MWRGLSTTMLFAIALAAATDVHWREAVPGYSYSFPRDHFEHPAFRTEWWYYTGNVWTAEGRRFGFELVFFRQGEQRPSGGAESTWRVDDVYLAHVALTDAQDRKFYAKERINRAGPGIAGASFDKRLVWNGNWSASWEGERQRLTGVSDDFRFALNVTPAKPLVIHGENGVSQKSPERGMASYYVSFPRLQVAGTIRIGDRDYRVFGQAWMDHEWFTRQLKPEQTGWDWFSAQFDDGSELMLFEIRRKDGSIDPYSSGTLIGKNGNMEHLARDEFALRPLEWWRSERTGARYPIAWKIDIPSRQIQLECRPVVRDQELSASQGSRYWEGAMDYSGSKRGVGYLEMTGYAGAVNLGN
jgi:predicted secreted hydrolase